MSIMKKGMVLALAGVMALGLSACSKKPVEGVVAEVNGQPITQELFDQLYGIQRNYVVASGGEEVLEEEYMEGITNGEQLRTQVLNQILQTEMFVQEAKKEGVEVNVEEVTAEVEEAIASMGGEETLAEIGISKDTYLKTAIDAKYTDGLIEKKLESFKVDEKDVEKYYEEHKIEVEQVVASHILVETEDEAKAVIERLNNGEDFAALATEVSLDTGSAQFGGDVGAFARGKMVPEFETAAFEAEVGVVTDPVKTDYGYHIIKVTEKKDDLDSVRADIEEILKADQWRAFVENLQKRTKNVIHIDLSQEVEAFKSEAPAEGGETPDKGVEEEKPAETPDEKTEEPAEEPVEEPAEEEKPEEGKGK